MPATISTTTEGIRRAGTRPRAIGTTKATAATIKTPMREISVITRVLLGFGSGPSVDLYVHLDRALLLGEEPDHLPEVLQTIHGMGQQTPQPG
jgi:hypothetical protein